MSDRFNRKATDAACKAVINTPFSYEADMPPKDSVSWGIWVACNHYNSGFKYWSKWNKESSKR